MHCYTLAQLLCFLLCGLTSGSLSIGSGLIPIEPIVDRVLGNNIQTFECLKRSRLTVCCLWRVSFFGSYVPTTGLFFPFMIVAFVPLRCERPQAPTHRCCPSSLGMVVLQADSIIALLCCVGVWLTGSFSCRGCSTRRRC